MISNKNVAVYLEHKPQMSKIQYSVKPTLKNVDLTEEAVKM